MVFSLATNPCFKYNLTSLDPAVPTYLTSPLPDTEQIDSSFYLYLKCTRSTADEFRQLQETGNCAVTSR